jgi:hypothetical protein
VRKHRPVLILAAVAMLLRLAAAVEIDPKLYLNDIQYLASEKLKGRLDGTRELDQAARYIADQFHAMGLKAAGDGGYFQRFRVTANSRAGKSNRLAYANGEAKTKLEMERDFCPSSMSSNGAVSGQVVFAGYGITAREYGYDDYAGIDVKGKIVLVLRHEPQEYDDNSVFGGKVYTNHAQIESKAVNAKHHGASALILAADTATHRGNIDQLDKLGAALGPDTAGIPFVEVKAEVADRWLGLAGRSIEGETRLIDGDLRGHAFELPASLTVDLSVDLRRETRPVDNVLAYLPGTSDEYLILGAHYDHVGLGEQYSMEPAKRGTIHPGADDNASGTSGVLELARWFSKHPGHRRGILFMAFGGEEFGLLGSNHYVEAPEMPLAKAVAMINLDMIGRIRNNRVFVGGVGTSANFKTLVEGLNQSEEAKFDLEDTDTGGYGSSDHYSFTPEGIPFLFFFSGLHPDYHTPSDTWDRVDAPQASRLLRLVGRVIESLLDSPERPVFQKRPG